MNRPQEAGTPDTAPTITVTAGTATEEWCTACKAYTLLTGELLAFAPGGVFTIGSWSWCEICEDPDDQRTERTRG